MKLLKLENLKLTFLNQIKARLLKMLKLELLKFELLEKTQRLTLKFLLLMKLKTRLLTLPLPNLPSPKKIPPRRDAGGAARRYD